MDHLGSPSWLAPLRTALAKRVLVIAATILGASAILTACQAGWLG